MDEVALHPLIARGLGSHGWGVLREQAYPTTWKKRGGANEKPWRAGGGEDLPLPRERERCDVVLTARAGLVLADEVRVRKRVRVVRREAQGTLFERAAEEAMAALHGESGGAGGGRHAEVAGASISPQDAMWIEVKALGQFEYADGVPGPNPSYASRLVRSVTADAGKLAGDVAIEYAGVLVVVFTADEQTAEHDVLMLAHRCLDRGLPIGGPIRRGVPILDRIGNGMCNVVMFPVRR